MWKDLYSLPKQTPTERMLDDHKQTHYVPTDKIHQNHELSIEKGSIFFTRTQYAN